MWPWMVWCLMRELIIDNTKIHTEFLGNMLTEISRAELSVHSHECPHCGNLVRYPSIARQQDIKDFEKIMSVAYAVMQRHGITAHLLADITAECHIRIAKNKSEKGNSA